VGIKTFRKVAIFLILEVIHSLSTRSLLQPAFKSFEQDAVLVATYMPQAGFNRIY
jgi:hypothetical protein